jgi:hypothetical protein
MPETLHCPSCGAPIRVQNPYVKVVACEFCGQVGLLNGSRLDPSGRSAGLIDLPSPLYLDATGRIEGRAFRVLGRLLYEYEGGAWHEWFVQFDGGDPGWLVEDEGRFSLLHKTPFDGPAPDYDRVRVGEVLRLLGREVFVTEKNEAVIAGGEGQLAFLLLPGERVRYLDGTAGDEQVGLEYADDETEAFVGRALAREAVEVDDEVYGWKGGPEWTGSAA